MSEFFSIWPPVLDNLRSRIRADDNLVLVFSPFIRSDALIDFIKVFPATNARFVVRWRLDDLISGASDLGVFEILQTRGIPLFLHPSIHLKLFEFASGIAYTGSSNITRKGLTIGDSYNEEMGVVAQLELDSYSRIRRLCDESRRVDEDIVDAYKQALADSKCEGLVLGTLELPAIEKKEFLVSELPASENPLSFLNAVSNYFETQSICPRMLHDMGTMNITMEDLVSEDLGSKLIQKFCSLKSIQQIVAKIRSQESMTFGAVTAFVHQIAQDVPVPYRSEIKGAISRLYPWLEHCFDDLSWSIPGSRSQVIKSSCVKRPPFA